MIKLEQKGFTIVELLISIGILGIVAPLLAVALVQILTFTERSRAGFEAQADTRNASGWISQDIVMATGSVNLVKVDCADSADPEDWATFDWTDYFADRKDYYTVSYCLYSSADFPLYPSPFPECRPSGQGGTQRSGEHKCLVRNVRVYDSDLNLTSDSSNVIARNIVSIEFTAVTAREIDIKIKSAPANRFGVEDEKTFKVLMRPTV